MPVYVHGKRPRPWEEQVKFFVKSRYAHLAAADAFPPGGADRAREAGYPPGFLAHLPGRVASAYCGCGYLLDGVDLGGVRTAVELGCGAGLDARLIRQRMDAGARFFALDFSLQMLRRVREAVGGSPETGGARLLAADMEHIPLRGGLADIVLANASLNLAVNKQRALEEVWRILRPGGRLVVRELIRDGALPEEIAQDPQAWNASLGGVCEQKEWEVLLRRAGFGEVAISGHAPFPPVVSVRIHARKPRTGRG